MRNVFLARKIQLIFKMNAWREWWKGFSSSAAAHTARSFFPWIWTVRSWTSKSLPLVQMWVHCENYECFLMMILSVLMLTDEFILLIRNFLLPWLVCLPPLFISSEAVYPLSQRQEKAIRPKVSSVHYFATVPFIWSLRGSLFPFTLNVALVMLKDFIKIKTEKQLDNPAVFNVRWVTPVTLFGKPAPCNFTITSLIRNL